MTILVTGGAGYIGSHTCIELISAGYDVQKSVIRVALETMTEYNFIIWLQQVMMAHI